MPRCVVVDDDTDIRESLRTYLAGFGWTVELAADVAGLREHLQRGPAPDVVVLDQMLPGEDGLSALRWLQRREPPVPVLMLTAMGDTASRVVGLELGADDYMTKPFEPRELVARLQVVLRRNGRRLPATEPVQVLRFAGWTFDRLTRQLVSAEGIGLPLSGAEFRLLNAFVERPRRVLSREQLIELTRAPGVEVSDRSIDLGVSRLRAKLGDAARDPPLLRTVRGEGYLFDVEVVS